MKVLFFFVFLGLGCQKERLVWKKTDHALAQLFDADEQSDGLLLFKAQRLALRSTHNELNKPMVMVRYSRASILNHELDAHPSVLGLHQGPSGENLALVEIQDAEHHTALAAMAHSEPGFACGRLRIVDPDFPLAENGSGSTPSPVYSEVRAYSEVRDLLALTDESKIRAGISHFVAMGTRFHTTTSGQAVANSIRSLITSSVGTAAASQFEFVEFAHKNSNQKSLIVRLAAPKTDAAIVVVGAHLDSIVGSRTSTNQSVAPGADDDASGMSTIIEVIRILASQSSRFERTVEFHFYAAEEVGLIGSAEIAASYRTAGKNVVAMMQLDMDAYSTDPTSKTIFLPDNDTDPILRRSVKDLLNTYLDGDYADGTIKGGTSDHESWTLQGYPTVFPFEHPTNYNPNIHTTSDTVATVNNTALAERFAKLTLAFLVHHAGWTAIAESTAAIPNPNALSADIALAASESSTNNYRLFAAAAQTLSKIEVCVVSDYDDTACALPAAELELQANSGSRRFFAADLPFSYQEGMFLRFNGYNQADQLTAQRTVQVSR